ncbi:uncharacterized protein LOC110018088 [Phalaenopsis equestris]|uniref:uncharacterized protein LOC110018088 n=1 Tax=Phalaenopsis equestris TaxID=78828 RepID=UPI0009E47EC6|nr:uncharacterized protein LOC110018088 [Phalaenopsis equestris]XP_020570974.1 uncharacterized protein LOC110018088 [Phalaenopsis equestris]XP_020570976.1 uncharacterized protein LOC110018088 [Phalaenopsis equestris]XP_020570977.1 uncharacterized protein LOC110018088 [Phalaenopsis equestris]XP_020570978.1 uncharacterized protein LOC110018088 [Phalaenopsis equestris]
MGRGRGKGKKLTVVPSPEDPGSGAQEHLPEYKSSEQPETPMEDDTNPEENVKVEVNGPSIKPVLTTKDEIVQQSGKKRKRFLQIKENSGAIMEENGPITGSKVEGTTKSIGYRQTGSRRKSKPHRAAEAVVPVMAVYNYKGF